MRTTMTSQRLDVLEARMAEVESSLRNQVALGRSHDTTTLKEHSAQLGSLMTNVGELTKARGTSNTMTASDEFRLAAKKVELPAFNGDATLQCRERHRNAGPARADLYGGDEVALVQDFARL